MDKLVGRIMIRRYESAKMAGYAGACHRTALCADPVGVRDQLRCVGVL
jgi:hypothetical protein